MVRGFVRRLRERKVIRVAGWYAVSGYAVFQIANTLLPALNVPRWVVTVIAGLFLLGFPLVVLLSYAFEWTPQGFRRLPPHAGASPRVGWFDWTLLGVTAAVLVFAIFALVIRPQFADRSPRVATVAAPAKSIAVLPFASFSAAGDTEYFADGLTEELINNLAQLPDLKVAGRTSSFYFKGRNEDLREVGRKLGVAHVLEGSVRRSGDNLRVTAQLIQVSDGFHLWSESFDSLMQDALDVQTQIARAVAGILEARLLARDADPLTGTARNPRAYQLELVAKSRLRKQELEELKMARSLYGELVMLEPTNPGPYIGYAEATISLAQNHLALDFEEARRESETAIQRALTLAPRSAEAWRVRGLIHRVMAIRSGSGTSEADALEAFRRAVDLDPRNADALAMLAAQLVSGGQTEQAAAMLRRSLEIDPLSRFGQQMLGTILLSQGRMGEARLQFESLVGLYPDFTSARIALGQLEISQGRLDAAVRVLDVPEVIRDDPEAGFMVAYLYANLGMPAQMNATLESIREPPPAAAVAHAAVLLHGGRSEEMRVYAREQFALTRDPIWLSAAVMLAVVSDDAWLAAAALEELAPGPLTDDAVLERSTPLDSLLTAEALRLTGQEDQARRILEALLTRFATAPGEYAGNEVLYIRALTHAALGQTDAALADFSRAVEQGFRQLVDFDYFTRVEDYPFMRQVVADPRYRQLAERIEADNRRMRDALIASR